MKANDTDSSNNNKTVDSGYTFSDGCCLGSIAGGIAAIIIALIMVFIVYGNDKFIAKEKAEARDRIIHDRDLFGSIHDYEKSDNKESPIMKQAEKYFLDNAVQDKDLNLYSEWMKDWLIEGNELHPVLGFYGRDGDETRYYVISDGAVITPLYGNSSVKLVAPKGTTFEIFSLGNNEVYYWDENGVAKCEAKYPVLYPEVIERLEKKNIPELDEALERNLKNKW